MERPLPLLGVGWGHLIFASCKVGYERENGDGPQLITSALYDSHQSTVIESFAFLNAFFPRNIRDEQRAMVIKKWNERRDITYEDAMLSDGETYVTKAKGPMSMWHAFFQASPTAC